MPVHTYRHTHTYLQVLGDGSHTGKDIKGHERVIQVERVMEMNKTKKQMGGWTVKYRPECKEVKRGKKQSKREKKNNT